MKPIRIALITEDELFHLAEAMNYLLANLPDEYQIQYAAVLRYLYTSEASLNQYLRPIDFLNVFGIMKQVLPSITSVKR